MAFYNVAMVAATVIAAGVSAYSTYASAENQKEMNDYNAEQGRLNALDAEQRGAIEAAEHRDKVRKMIARQNAGFSASGVNAATGTALEIQTETAGMGELDALRIVNNAQRQSAGLNAQANIDSWSGRNAMRTGYWNIAGQSLSTASNLANTYRGSKKGAFGN